MEKLSSRVAFGQNRSIEQGKVMGSNRLYGYNKKDGKLTIKEDESEMVRKIYNYYAVEDVSLREFERRLYDQGYCSHNGTMIPFNVIGNIIKNSKYKGYYCGNKL